MIKLLFITGDRAEYDLIYPVISLAQDSKDFDSRIIITGSHLVSKFGNTINEIKKDKIKILAKINNLLASDEPSARAKSMAIELMGFIDAIDLWKPDIILVLGDREECLAAGALSIYSDIILAHIGGGDKVLDGNSDNSIRDAVTKLAHVHFASTKKSKNRLLILGEENWRCNNVGATGLDRIRLTKFISSKELFKKLGFYETPKNYFVLIQHSLLPDYKKSKAHIIETLEALRKMNLPVFVGRTNSDPGNHGIQEVINHYCNKYKIFNSFKNLPREEFVNLLRHAKVLIGNSSAGIIESPILKLPVVNVGTRQLGRENAGNVIFVKPNRKEIFKAINKSLFDKKYLEYIKKLKNPYGDGFAASRIIKKLKTVYEQKTKYLRKIQSK